VDLQGKRVLVLGGAGLVGTAVCRELLAERPSRLIVSSLYAHEVDAALQELRRQFPDSETELSGTHGNLFVRSSLKDTPRDEILGDTAHRRAIIDDVLLPLNTDVLDRSHLYRTLAEHRPDVVVDCVNTATALAYQDLYRSAQEVLGHLDAGHGVETFRDVLERHLCTLYTPQLIRHIQILHHALLDTGSRAYVKIGTSGTGGMGLNIPYTHSEERPSRVLLSKSAMAGAHSLLLFLMARTPGAPVIREIKPAAAIAWKRIGYGPVLRGGRPIRLFDCPPAQAVDLEAEKDLGAHRAFAPVSGDADGLLKSVFVDTGENGVFSRAEFEVITSLGQMEFVTPEEIARNVVFELRGIASGHDIINALDNAILSPTYRAGVLRHHALERMRKLEKEHRVASVAFEMLGPPRLSKLLFEAEILRRGWKTIGAVAEADPERMAEEAVRLIQSDVQLRAEMLSVGVPILLPDGRRLLRGPKLLIPTPWDAAEPSPDRVDRWAEDGWVDLRAKNLARWKERCRVLQREIDTLDSEDTSSRYDRDTVFWEGEPEINIGKLVGWLFISEERGLRMKA
jgi:NAD(P)-dependent dehydrogenase (short-subunit alcohol dehydrogenase family)